MLLTITELHVGFAFVEEVVLAEAVHQALWFLLFVVSERLLLCDLVAVFALNLR